MLFKTIAEHERGVILRLGRLLRVAGPGRVWVLPLVDSLVRVDLRPFLLEVDIPIVTSRDDAWFHVTLVAGCCVLQPERAVLGVTDCHRAIEDLLGAIFREAASAMDAEELTGDRQRLGRAIKKIANEATLAWGVDVQTVTVNRLEAMSR